MAVIDLAAAEKNMQTTNDIPAGKINSIFDKIGIWR
ncbi:hypothetical protein CASFOL_014761 [Castilleja foliolosa]|uniref:Uncharacterized protein n=1 Tax=Castilleja foliolosa TaxID=1961234 RepID=A0ABD3DBR9_9LAMI